VAIEVARRRFTVEEHHRMGEAGAACVDRLTDDVPGPR
jgi:hypothetical protein